MLLHVLLKSFGTLTHKRLLMYFAASLLLSAAALSGFSLVMGLLIGSASLVGIDWLDTVLGWFTGFAGLTMAWLMFPVVTPMVAGFFQDAVIGYVEEKEYPEAEKAKSFPLSEELVEGLKFAGKALLINILMLPLVFIPVVNVIAYWLVNSYLFGREFFEMVAARYKGPRAAKEMRSAYPFYIYFHALPLVAVGLFVPIALPFVGVVVMTHLYHRLDWYWA